METPVCIPAISIVGIALGALTLLARLLGSAFLIAIMTTMRGKPEATDSTVGYYAYQIASSLVFAGFAVLLLAASIACLRLKEWGRVWLIRYAIAYPIAMVVEFISTVITSTHDADDLHAALGQNATTTGPATAPTMNLPHAAGLLVGEEALVMLLMMILPVCILIFLRRPTVRAAFKS